MTIANTVTLSLSRWFLLILSLASTILGEFEVARLDFSRVCSMMKYLKATPSSDYGDFHVQT